MHDISLYGDMPLTAVVAQFLNNEEWEDEISVSEDRLRATVSTTIGIQSQPYRLFFEIYEDDQRVSVFLYSPFTVPPERAAAMARILNRINFQLTFGRLAFQDEGEAEPIQFLAVIDADSSSLSVQQVSILLSFCFSMDRFHELLSAVAMTKIPEDQLWKEHLDREQVE